MQLIDELQEKISVAIQETQDSIIIDAIYPFAKTVEARISKEELREAILKYYGKHDPVKHGHWVETEDGGFVCSECGFEYAQEYEEYCAHCGAKNE